MYIAQVVIGIMFIISLPFHGDTDRVYIPTLSLGVSKYKYVVELDNS
jgi:hypothetical protein